MAFHRYLPEKTSIRFKVLELAHRNGGLTTAQAYASLPDERREGVAAALRDNNDRGLMNRIGNVFEVAPYVRDMLEKKAPPTKEAYVGEVAGSRYNKSFTPLKVTPWAIHTDRLREVSFKSVSGSLQPFAHLA